jgi:hypothetical protein
MAKGTRKNRQAEIDQGVLFDGLTSPPASPDLPPPANPGAFARRKLTTPRVAPTDVRAIQDLVWNEARWALTAAEQFTDDAPFEAYLAEHLPQNSPSTRTRYAQTLVRWFFRDGVRGLAAGVWIHYRDPALADEILRYLYLRAEALAGAVVAEALLPIAEHAVIPESYLPNFLRGRFGADTPAKTIRRLKTNLRKLGFLVRVTGSRDTLRVPAHSATAFLLVLHHLFALRHSGAVEFRTVAADPFWKYLGFKTEDQLRSILKDSMDRGLLAKYVLADRIESISFRYSFEQFIEGKMTA